MRRNLIPSTVAKGLTGLLTRTDTFTSSQIWARLMWFFCLCSRRRSDTKSTTSWLPFTFLLFKRVYESGQNTTYCSLQKYWKYWKKSKNFVYNYTAATNASRKEYIDANSLHKKAPCDQSLRLTFWTCQSCLLSLNWFLWAQASIYC